MTVTRGLPLRLGTLLTGFALAASACGDGGSSSPVADPGSSPTSPVSASVPATGNVALGKVGPLEQLVRVRKYGVGFGLPKEWSTLDAERALDPKSRVLKEVSQRTGIAPKKLVRTVLQTAETLSVAEQGADDWLPDNVSSVGSPPFASSDEDLRRELASVGAKLGQFRHVSTPAGDVTTVPYRRITSGRFVFSQLLVVDLGSAAVTITITSSSSSRAGTLAEEVQRTLQPL
jgi:hypothetical protein